MEETAPKPKNIRDECIDVLKHNDRGNYTIPSEGLYPHQWLWDSCFTAIGLRHMDIERAKAEILSLLEAQWHNGMVPNMVLRSPGHTHDANIWRSWANPNSPDGLKTSGITQPPLIAEAAVQIGQKMKLPERRSWYKQVYPGILAYHEWLYRERNPHEEGLAVQIHPWEVGLDNTPPWIAELHLKQKAWWITVVEKLHIRWLPSLFRRDTRFVPAEQRADIVDLMGLFSSQRRLRRKNYDMDRILNHALFAIEDVTFNAIFIRANQHLAAMAKTIGKQLPEEFVTSMQKTESTLEELWDPYTSQYYCREFITHRLLKEPSIATLMPLYAGTLSKERAEHLVSLMKHSESFGTSYPVPSVPQNSPWFSPVKYWQGPTWVNTNWLIIDGLRRHGFTKEADMLRNRTVEMVERSGCYEYFNPLDGQGIGARNFSWTAALTLDLIDS
ncbi:glycoside hydrolase [Candidatus Saccharibacteria bacterium]|nr:glycoside hydrolase [Candidatus Saccharibacteria bacterium]